MILNFKKKLKNNSKINKIHFIMDFFINKIVKKKY